MPKGHAQKAAVGEAPPFRLNLARGLSVLGLGFLFLAGCQAPKVDGSACALQQIPVISADPSRNEVYAARARGVEVQFRNENAPAQAEVFPDPRVTVRNLKTGQSCDIKDGSGIWSGRSVYLDANEHVLILNEYSGASDTLIFYNPETCQRLAEVDVSNKRWEISGGRIRTGQECSGDDVASCRSIRELRLDERCVVTVNSKS